MICLVDERISEKCERGLLKRGFRVIKMPGSDRLSPPVSAHPDILLFYHNNNIITSAEYCEKFPYVFSYIREFSEASITFTSDIQEPKYPNDAIFNALAIGDCIFLKEDTVSDSIKTYAKKNGLRIISVKQGYPACTALAFGCSAITADEGMKRALTQAGFCVTLISNGDISLPPYEYGFIGGTAGISGKTVYFLGDVLLHRDGQKIVDAIHNEGYSYVSLSDEPLADLGRIIFVD